MGENVINVNWAIGISQIVKFVIAMDTHLFAIQEQESATIVKILQQDIIVIVVLNPIMVIRYWEVILDVVHVVVQVPLLQDTILLMIVSWIHEHKI